MTDVYGKSVASIESVDDEKFGPTGGFTAVLSTPSEDRDGDQLFRDEWKEFTQERYPLDMDHGMSVADTIGSFVPYFDGQKMMMDAVFASTPKAQEVRALVTPDENGIRHISSVSVAFMVDKTKKSGEPRRELLNAGVVAIPSNRDAVILASKAASALKDAFSQAGEDGVPEEVKSAVLDALGDAPEEPKAKGTVYIDVRPRIDYQKFVQEIADGLKAPGGTGDGPALTQAIHDAAIHLGAVCFPLVSDEDPTGSAEGANKSVEPIESKDFVDIRQLIAGVDAVIDEACKLAGSVDRSTLPEEAGQALDLLTAAQESIDEVMETLGIYDPDDDDKSIDLEAIKPEGLTMEQFEAALQKTLSPSEEEAPETPAPAEEAAAAVSADESDDMAMRIRALRMRTRARMTY